MTFWRTTPHRSRRRDAGIGVGITLAVLAMAGLGALGYVTFMLWPRWPAAATSESAPSLPITVGDVLFNVPTTAIRVAAQRSPGTQPRLDLVFRWPDLTPPPAGAQPTLSDELKPTDLFVSIAPARGTLPLLERIRTIYPRYTGGSAFPGPAGLTAVSFRDDTPYQNEDLYFDVAKPETFTARCTRPKGLIAGVCLLERAVGGTEITVRFPRDWLEQWREVAVSTDRLIERLRAPR
ncbi:MAG: hypothetical protein J0H62_06420 [Rhizobiales bacterium]|nr:hypothetical protein [Hyphomicrobiales bacterium]